MRCLALAAGLCVVEHGQVGSAVCAEPARRLRAPGLELHHGDGGPAAGFAFTHLPIYVHPIWVAFSGFSDQRGTVEGTLDLELFYPAEAANYVSDPRTMLHVENQVSHTRTTLAEIQLESESGEIFKASSVLYKGEFKQSLDEECFPFDDQEVQFVIKMQPPGDRIFSLLLNCLKDQTAIEENGVLVGCVTPMDMAAAGFNWGNMECRLDKDAAANDGVTCKILGHRITSAKMKQFFLPSTIFIFLSFCSFKLSIKAAMPRIATSMLALLNLTSLRNSLAATLPTTGAVSWMEEYFVFGMVLMAINLCCHIAAFDAEGCGNAKVRELIDAASYQVMFPVFFILCTMELHRRECLYHVPSSLSLALVVLAWIFFLISIGFVASRHKDALEDRVQTAKKRLTGSGNGPREPKGPPPQLGGGGQA